MLYVQYSFPDKEVNVIGIDKQGNRVNGFTAKLDKVSRQFWIHDYYNNTQTNPTPSDCYKALKGSINKMLHSGCNPSNQTVTSIIDDAWSKVTTIFRN